MARLGAGEDRALRAPHHEPDGRGGARDGAHVHHQSALGPGHGQPVRPTRIPRTELPSCVSSRLRWAARAWAAPPAPLAVRGVDASWRGAAPSTPSQGSRRSPQGNQHRQSNPRACRRGSWLSSSFQQCSTSAAPSTMRWQPLWRALSTNHWRPTTADWLASSLRPSCAVWPAYPLVNSFIERPLPPDRGRLTSILLVCSRAARVPRERTARRHQSGRRANAPGSAGAALRPPDECRLAACAGRRARRSLPLRTPFG